MNRILAGLFLLGLLAGCERHRSEAIVLEKEHIAARPPTPTPAPSVEPAPKGEPLPESAEAEADAEPALREMAPDEIAVDGVVMKEALRGTEQDPRARAEEQWLLKVRTTDGGRLFNIHADRVRYEKIQIGERVKVSYRVGKYTRTVWTADLE